MKREQSWANLPNHVGKKSILITSVSAPSISNGILWSELFFTQINPWIKFNTDQNVEVNFGFHAVKQVVAGPESRRRCHVTGDKLFTTRQEKHR